MSLPKASAQVPPTVPATVRPLVRRMEAADVPQSIALAVQAFSRSSDTAHRDFLRMALTRSYQAGDVMKVEHGWVAELDGRIVARGQVLDLPLRVGCVTLRAAGVHAVATDPAVTGRSFMLPMFRYGWSEVQRQGMHLGIGFTQHSAIFSLVSGTTVCADYEFDMDVAALVPSHNDGETIANRFRRVEPTDLAFLVEATNHAQREAPLSLVRTVSIWHQLERQPPEVWRQERSVVGLRWSPDVVEVRDYGSLASSEAEALEDARSTLEFVAKLAVERKVSKILCEVPPTHPLARVAEQFGRKIRRSFVSGTGCMASIFDVDYFLQTMRPELAQRAQYVTHKNVALRCVVDGVERTLVFGAEASDTPHQIVVECSKSVLLLLMVGTFSWRQLLAISEDATDKTGLRCLGDPTLLDALFSERHPYIGRCDRW